MGRSLCNNILVRTSGEQVLMNAVGSQGSVVGLEKRNRGVDWSFDNPGVRLNAKAMATLSKHGPANGEKVRTYRMDQLPDCVACQPGMYQLSRGAPLGR